MNKPIRPSDILDDSEDFVELGGLTLRKGSIAAFLKNIDVYEDPKSTQSQKAEALDMLKELAPAIIASGLHKHAVFKNKAIEKILIDKNNK